MNLVTKSASRCKRICCGGPRAMRFWKKTGWRKNRRRVKKDLKFSMWKEDSDIIHLTRDEMVTGWEIC